jgi:hypothetical protein
MIRANRALQHDVTPQFEFRVVSRGMTVLGRHASLQRMF